MFALKIDESRLCCEASYIQYAARARIITSSMYSPSFIFNGQAHDIHYALDWELFLAKFLFPSPLSSAGSVILVKIKASIAFLSSSEFQNVHPVAI